MDDDDYYTFDLSLYCSHNRAFLFCWFFPFPYFLHDKLIYLAILPMFHLLKLLQKGTYDAEEKVIKLQSELVGNASKVIKADHG